MNIKKDDNVIMLSGKDRNKKGKVLGIFLVKSKKNPEGISKLAVQGLNLIKKHQKARKQGQKGQIIDKERIVATSSVQLLCPKCDKPTRVGHVSESGKKMRVCKKCEATF